MSAPSFDPASALRTDGPGGLRARSGRVRPVLIAAYIWSLVAGTAALMYLLGLPLRLLRAAGLDPTGRWIDACSRVVWGRLPFWLNPFWTLRVEGAERLRSGGPYLILPNHQSMVDVLALQGLPLQVKWVTSARFFQVPLLGAHMRAAGYIGVHPGDLASIRAMMREAGAWLGRGVSVSLFPEGTRSPDGEVHPFQLGPFRIALDSGATIVPVAVVGTREALPKGSWLPIGRGPWTIRVRVLDPIPEREYREMTAAALARAVHARIAAAVAEMRGRKPVPPARRPPLASGGEPS